MRILKISYLQIMLSTLLLFLTVGTYFTDVAFKPTFVVFGVLTYLVVISSYIVLNDWEMKQTKTQYLTMLGHILLYSSYMRITERNNNFAVIVPFMLTYLFYQNIKLLRLVNVLVLLVNVIEIGIEIVTLGPQVIFFYTNSVILRIIVLSALGLTYQAINNHNLAREQATIREKELECERQRATTEKLLQMGNELMIQAKQFETLFVGMDTKTNAAAESISQIAIGIEEAASSTEEQLHQTQCIEKDITIMQQTFTKSLDTFRHFYEELSSSYKTLKVIIGEAHQVSELATSTQEAMSYLKEQSSKIKNITSCVSNLADQTNLLALNAAIEAARAGEQGRGFSVVADEVNKLSAQTREYTKDIETVVNGLMGEMEKVTGSIEQLVSANHKQYSELHETDQTFENNITSIHAMKESFLDLQENLNHIGESMKHMLDHIENLSAVSQEISASAETTTMSVNNLKDLKDETVPHLEKLVTNIEKLKTI